MFYHKVQCALKERTKIKGLWNKIIRDVEATIAPVLNSDDASWISTVSPPHVTAAVKNYFKKWNGRDSFPSAARKKIDDANERLPVDGWGFYNEIVSKITKYKERFFLLPCTRKWQDAHILVSKKLKMLTCNYQYYLLGILYLEVTISMGAIFSTLLEWCVHYRLPI